MAAFSLEELHGRNEKRRHELKNVIAKKQMFCCQIVFPVT